MLSLAVAALLLVLQTSRCATSECPDLRSCDHLGQVDSCCVPSPAGLFLFRQRFEPDVEVEGGRWGIDGLEVLEYVFLIIERRRIRGKLTTDATRLRPALRTRLRTTMRRLRLSAFDRTCSAKKVSLAPRETGRRARSGKAWRKSGKGQ